LFGYWLVLVLEIIIGFVGENLHWYEGVPRNITHHEEKWPATKDQVEFVRDIHRNIVERLVVPDVEKVF
jgi:hypothetical protein